MARKKKRAIRTQRHIGEAEVDLSHYKRGLAETASGNPTMDIDDEVARLFRGKELDEVYEEAARILKKAGREEGTTEDIVKSLRKRYGSLNPGMQRMNLGNRARAALKENRS